MLDRTSDFINLSRWAAAFVVAASHLRQIVMCDYSTVRAPNLPIKLFYFVTQMGHEAVMVFFVISGYLIGGSAILKLRERGFDVVDYATHRAARIYTAFLPALLIFGALDVIGSSLLDATGLYSHPLGIMSLGNAVTSQLAPTDMLGNLLMLQFGIVAPFGSNGPLWSLAYEWWYYALFGAAMLVTTARSLALRVVGIGAICAMMAFLSFGVFEWGLIWLLGAAAAVYAARRFPLPPLWLSLSLGVLALVGARVSHMAPYDMRVAYWRFAIDLVVAAAYALILLSYHRPGKRARFAAAHHRLAGFSYSLYLIHFPLMIFTVALVARVAGIGFLGQPGLATGLYYAAMLAFLTGTAWAFGQVTEGNTANVRRLLLGIARPSSKAIATKPR